MTVPPGLTEVKCKKISRVNIKKPIECLISENGQRSVTILLSSPLVLELSSTLSTVSMASSTSYFVNVVINLCQLILVTYGMFYFVSLRNFKMQIIS